MFLNLKIQLEQGCISRKNKPNQQKSTHLCIKLKLTYSFSWLFITQKIAMNELQQNQGMHPLILILN